MAFRQATRLARLHPWLSTGLVAGTVVASVPVYRAARRDYQGFLDLGQGGIPYNVFGWSLQAAARLYAIPDPLDAAPFQQPPSAVAAAYGERGTRSFLGALDQREEVVTEVNTRPNLTQRSRPKVPHYVVPQRQISDLPPPGTREQQDAFLHALAAANPDVLQILPSRLEGEGTAALCRRASSSSSSSSPTSPPDQEVCHAHHEGSAHMILSLPDAAAVLAAGWGQRHGLAGKPLTGLPPTYVMVYAPRNAAEMAVWKRLAVASARYAASDLTSKDIVVPE